MKKSILTTLTALVLTALCMATTAEADTPIVFTSITPQTFFVKRIAGDRVQVEALVPPGGSPATYEPTPRQMAALSEAKLFFRVGVPFEKVFIPKLEASIKGLPVVDTRKGITLRKMKAHHHGEEHEEHEGHEEHEAHEAGHHHHGGTDPHIWLSPVLAKIQAKNIADALIAMDPAGKATYTANLASLDKDLDTLNADLKTALAPIKGKTFMVFHPAWGYFADAYSLQQQPIEIEGKDPSGRQLERMISLAKKDGVRVIFVQPQFSMKSAKRVAAAIDGAVVPIDPLAADYITNLQKVAQTVRKALIAGKQ